MVYYIVRNIITILIVLIGFQSFSQNLISKVIPQYKGGIAVSYEYDSLGRRIKLSSTYNEYTFHYSDRIVERCTKTSCVKIILNSNGLEHKRLHYKDSSVISIREYNKNGNLIYWKLIDDWGTYSRITVRNFLYQKGNLIQEDEEIINNGVNDTTSRKTTRSYEYYENQPNSLGNLNYGMSFSGKSSKNLLKKILHSDGFEVLFEYEFDEEGRVIAQHRIDGESANQKRTTLFEYWQN